MGVGVRVDPGVGRDELAAGVGVVAAPIAEVGSSLDRSRLHDPEANPTAEVQKSQQRPEKSNKTLQKPMAKKNV